MSNLRRIILAPVLALRNIGQAGGLIARHNAVGALAILLLADRLSGIAIHVLYHIPVKVCGSPLPQ
jgi:hypothetical protein